MNTRNYVFILVLVLAFIVAACSPQAAPEVEMAEKEASSSEVMDDKEDESMMEEKDDDAMMEDKDDDSMMEEKKDDTMMSDDDDQMMSDKEDEMEGHQDDSMMDDKEDDSMMEEKDDDMADDMSDAMMRPDWHKTTFTNARTGETFTIADFKDKVVLVETLAMWCSNCLKQQGQVQALHDLLGDRDDFVSLGIDIDPNENAEALRAYTDKNGFDWLYTVAPTEVSREIGQLYGDQYLNPPSTPMLIIDREGEVHLLPFGIKSAEELLEAVNQYL